MAKMKEGLKRQGIWLVLVIISVLMVTSTWADSKKILSAIDANQW